MATIVLRSSLSRPLTNNEVDANFNNLNTEKIERNGSVPFTAAQSMGGFRLTNLGQPTAISDGVPANLTGGFGLRNRIINGAMRIHQRATASVNTDGVYVIDRWIAFRQAGLFIAQQDSVVPPGFTNSILWSPGNTTATAYSGLEQRIEGLNVADLGWGTPSAQAVTVSFWVRSGLTGQHNIALRNGTSTRSYCATYTVNAANTWEYKTITIPGDTSGSWATDNTWGVGLWFNTGGSSTQAGNSWLGSAATAATGSVNHATSSANFWITGVQFEVGSVATPFEFRPFGLELSLCQRYFERRIYPDTHMACVMHAYSTTQALGNVQFLVEKRNAPFVTASAASTWGIWNTTGVSITPCTIEALNASTFQTRLRATVGAGLVAGNAAGVHTASGQTATLDYSAEL